MTITDSQTCPFCTAPANSEEHVIPRWMSRRFLAKASKRAYFTLYDNGLERHRSRMMNQKAMVCADCNNGWMSQLEQRARPILLALATDLLPDLSESQQEILSKWLFKTAVIFELLAPEAGRTSTHEQRTELRTGRVPTGWSAHVARIEPKPSEAIVVDLGPIVNWAHDDGSHRGRARLTTTRFGQMAAQVLLHNLDELPQFADLLGGDDFAAQIWPVENSVRWPPGRTLTLEWFDIVCNIRNPTDGAQA